MIADVSRPASAGERDMANMTDLINDLDIVAALGNAFIYELLRLRNACQRRDRDAEFRAMALPPEGTRSAVPGGGLCGLEISNCPPERPKTQFPFEWCGAFVGNTWPP